MIEKSQYWKSLRQTPQILRIVTDTSEPIRFYFLVPLFSTF